MKTLFLKDFYYKTDSFTNEELVEIARLHQRWIPSGFLSSLGIEFLVRLYASIAKSPDGVLIAVKDSHNKVMGFVSGTTSVRSVYKHLMRHHFLFLAFFFLKFIFSKKTLKRILESKKYSAQKHSGVNDISAELLSVVVDERLQGAGIAQDLFKRLVLVFHQKGVGRFKIIVGSQLVRAKKFYVKAGAIKIAEIELHQRELSDVYQYSM